jgi:predicted acylesterase/phospholipase RssA
LKDDAKPRRRALAFSSGGLDTIMQLGVAHALLVSRSAAPDYVVGISAGAINAAALAEVLQAGPPHLPADAQDALSAEDRLPFQVDQLRNFIHTYLDLPRTVANAVMPDSLEVLARDPLKPLELPIHFDRERQAREAANESKAGIVHLINDLFAVPLTVATATRVTRRILGLAEAKDFPSRVDRLKARLWNEGLLIALVWGRFPEIARLAGTFAWAYIVGPNRAALRGLHGAATADRLMRQQRIVTESWRPVRTVLQLFAMAHVFLLVTLFWLSFIVPRIVGLLFAGERPRPRRWLGALGQKLGRLRKMFRGAFPRPVTRVLQFYGLADGLANTDLVKQLLVQCFDRQYYGNIDLATLLDRSLDRENRPERATDAYRKRLSDYRLRTPSVLVAPIAADVATGEMRVLDQDVPVVDALLAANAVAPFFPAVRIDEAHERSRRGAAERFKAELRAYRVKAEARWLAEKKASEAAREQGAPLAVQEPSLTPPTPPEAVASEGGQWFIDGSNISNEAIAPLLGLVREELRTTKDDSAAVDIYPVSNLPISKGRLAAGAGEKFDGVLDVVPRALQLKRFRDASVEQRLTEIYTQALPDGQSYYVVQLPGGETRTFVKANIYPLELDRSVGINHRLLMGEKLQYSEGIYQTIADGCRATLEAALPATIAVAAGANKTVKCSVVMAVRNGVAKPLPGSADTVGPGLSEICSRCALVREAAEMRERATLNAPSEARRAWPEWPQERREPQPPVPRPPSSASVIEKLEGWPRPRAGIDGTGQSVDGAQRPLVSLLFGGGVFRGVFHMGVTNALSEMGIHPDVVAGSSVGSIIAAMIAQVFSNPSARGRDIAHLAATFLSIDRLVLTDRFADFIRRFTLRAADTPIALRDLDSLFRRYDEDGARTFNQRMRVVAAGIERLTYISPFELFDLLRDLRLERFGHFMSEIRGDIQDFLDRGGVGEEILGSEPLVGLIEHHVLSGRRSLNRNIEDVFESFRDCGIYFLATATNLEAGQLEILGESILSSAKHPSLRYGLLASSAFPAVFRPRQSWEIFRRSNVAHQYIDGGVIDNLPLDAVAQFLDRASRAKSGAIARRPEVMVDGEKRAVPHLIFTASLEVDPPVGLRNGDHIGNCLEVSNRAKTFKYNRKIDAFASTQSDLRLIHSNHPTPNILDLHVVAVKPKWLCSTFGFHPMLGFRRRKQKQSIAHGCASTFATVFQMQMTIDDGRMWLRAWGAHDDLHVDASTVRFVDHTGQRTEQPVPGGSYVLEPAAKRPPGHCWFREGVACPFSQPELAGAGVAKNKREELEEIYWLCGNPATHRPV